jgi:hypothetical protein
LPDLRANTEKSASTLSSDKESLLMEARLKFSLFTILLLSSTAAAADPFWSVLGVGPHGVGFRVIYGHDQGRKWRKNSGDSDPGRPIRVSVWYPASPAKDAQPMKYGDYLHHNRPSEFRNIDEKLEQSDRESWVSDMREIAPGRDKDVFALPAGAFRDAPPVKGRFPLVLYSGGKASRADANIEIGEFLASNGYIVATVPQLGPSEDDIELGSSAKEIALHADDFDAALWMLRNQPEVKSGLIATAGHSAGGEVAVELALRHPEVIAVIGLDASYGTSGGSHLIS